MLAFETDTRWRIWVRWLRARIVCATAGHNRIKIGVPGDWDWYCVRCRRVVSRDRA